MSLLEIKDVNISYHTPTKTVYAVQDVSLNVEEEDSVGIVGESGSGKTTVVNMITRLIDVTKGKIILDGEDITNLTGKKLREAYRKMQMVFQTPAGSFDPAERR